MKKLLHFSISLVLIVLSTQIYSQDFSKALGKTPGSFDVSATGGATYNVPIEIPKGTNGMQPNISLQYNSQGGMSFMGKGWNIAGLTMITRVGKTIFHDNKVEGIKFNNTDHYAVDGMMLVPMNGDNGANGTEYRTEIESYVKYFSEGSLDNSNSSIKAYLKNGTVIEYGSGANSRNITKNRTAPMAWAVSKIIDEHGNYMTFTYINETSSNSGDFLISEINYAANDAASLAPYCKIIFEYETYDGFLPYGFDGNLYTRTRRLKEIKTYSEGNLVKVYQVQYVGKDLIKSSFTVSLIKEFNNQNEELNSTDFSFLEHKGIGFTNNQIQINDLSYNNISVKDMPEDMPEEMFEDMPVFYVTGDINGDGYKDIVSIGSKDGTSVKIYHKLNQRNGQFATMISNNVFVDGLDQIIGVRLIDWNRDGKDELIILQKNKIYQYEFNDYSGLFISRDEMLSVESVMFFSDKGYSIESRPGLWFLSDVNGDGIQDLVYVVINGIVKVRYGNSYGFESDFVSNAINLSAYSPTNNRVMMSDVNGDGMNDIVIFHNDRVSVYLANGNGFDSGENWYTGFTYNDGWRNGVHDIQLVDINGDGMADIVGFGASRLYVALSTGKSFSFSNTYNGNYPQADWNPTDHPRYFIDLNSDGLVDIVAFGYNHTFYSLNTGKTFVEMHRTPNASWQRKF